MSHGARSVTEAWESGHAWNQPSVKSDQERMPNFPHALEVPLSSPGVFWTLHRGDGVAQSVERRTRDPKTGGSNPVRVRRSTRKNCDIFFRKNVVLIRCRCAQPRCAHARVRMIMYALYPVVHVRVGWIMKTRKVPACTFY